MNSAGRLRLSFDAVKRGPQQIPHHQSIAHSGLEPDPSHHPQMGYPRRAGQRFRRHLPQCFKLRRNNSRRCAGTAKSFERRDTVWQWQLELTSDASKRDEVLWIVCRMAGHGLDERSPQGR
jgi:hypothetical protein